MDKYLGSPDTPRFSLSHIYHFNKFFRGFTLNSFYNKISHENYSEHYCSPFFGRWKIISCARIFNHVSGDFSTSILHLATIAAITPRAANHGASVIIATAPAVPHVTGIDRRTLPFSSFMTMRFTVAS